MSSLDKYLYRVPFQWSFLHPKYWGTWLMILFLLICAYTPVRIRDWIAVRLTPLVYRIAKKPVHIIDCNLKTCFSDMTEQERKQLIYKNIEMFLLSVLGQAELAFRSKCHIMSRYNVQGLEHFKKLVDNGEQAIFVAGHTWGLEYAGTYFMAGGMPMVTFINQHKNPIYNWLSVKQRTRFCDSVYVREGGIRVMLKGMKEGKHLFFLPDQDHGADKCEFAPFFDTEKASLPILSRLCKATNGRIMPIHIAYDVEYHRFNLTIEEPFDCSGGEECKESEAQFLNHLLEDLIMRDLTQYMWILRILKTRPEGQASIYKKKRKSKS